MKKLFRFLGIALCLLSPVLGKAQVLLGGDELPRPRDGIGLGVTTEAEVAQHLEERQVARVADVVDVVGAQALLAGACADLGHGLDALVVLLELVHASVGQKQRRIVGNQRRGGIELAALRLKEVQEVVADLGRRHGLVVGAHGSPRIRCGNVQTGILAMRGHIPPEVQAQTGTYEANTT